MKIDYKLYGWEDANSNIQSMSDINTSAFVSDDTLDKCITSSIDDINPFIKKFKAMMGIANNTYRNIFERIWTRHSISCISIIIL